MPNVHGYGRGDQYVRVTVVVPTKMTEEEKELLRKLADIRGEEVENAKGKSFFDKVEASSGVEYDKDIFSIAFGLQYNFN